MKLYGLDKVVYHPLYVALVMVMVIPLDVLIALRGQWIWATILILMQLPWFFSGVAGKFEYTKRLMGL